MTSITSRLQSRVDARPVRVADPAATDAARRILAVGAALSAATLGLAVVGLLLDQRTIDGEAAWAKPANFGVSITVYLLTLRWILGSVRAHRRRSAVLATVLVVAFGLETLWVDVQVLRGTTSHFNARTPGDAAAFDAAGGVVSFILIATIGFAVLALRTRDLDAGTAAGIRWGLSVAVLGMLAAGAMLANGHTASTIGAHTVGAPDGGPGMVFTGWSLAHGDLRIAHFVGLHGLQVLPLAAWLLQRRSGLDPRTRRDLIRIGGTGYIGLVALVLWQAERGQALLRPDGTTLAAAGLLVAGVAAASGLVLLRARRGAPRPSLAR